MRLTSAQAQYSFLRNFTPPIINLKLPDFINQPFIVDVHPSKFNEAIQALNSEQMVAVRKIFVDCIPYYKRNTLISCAVVAITIAAGIAAYRSIGPDAKEPKLSKENFFLSVEITKSNFNKSTTRVAVIGTTFIIASVVAFFGFYSYGGYSGSSTATKLIDLALYRN
jgi:hypothetical protein